MLEALHRLAHHADGARVVETLCKCAPEARQVLSVAYNRSTEGFRDDRTQSSEITPRATLSL
jgi:hypothetical protein